MASLVFNVASQGIAEQTLDWEGATTLRAILLTGAGTPVKTNATVTAALAEVNVDECSATNYSRQTLANAVITQSGNKTLFDADNPVWTTLGGASNQTITGALIYIGTALSADDGTNIPIVYHVFSSSLTTNGGNVTWTKDSTNKFFYLDGGA